MNLDVPARYGVLCLVVWISLCIGAIPDLDVEVIDIHTRVAVVLRLHPEGVQTRSIDGARTLELGAHTADRQPVDARALKMQVSIIILEVQLACRYVVLVPGCEPEVCFAAGQCAIIIRIEPAAACHLPGVPVLLCSARLFGVGTGRCFCGASHMRGFPAVLGCKVDVVLVEIVGKVSGKRLN